MIRDEFNSVKVTNEKQVGRSEFGKTQQTEYTFHKDNKLPDVELNDKVQAQSTSTSQSSLDTTNLLKQSTGSAASTSSTTTVVTTSSATASSIAAASTSVVTVASVVAVTAISVVTGISVALHDYQFKFNSFLVSAHEVTYDLSIFDTKEQDYETGEYQEYNSSEEESNPTFNLRVYNKDYDNTHELWLGSNYGTFEGLNLGEKYTIVLTESRYGGETLFEEEFSTVTSYAFNLFQIFEEADFLKSTIYVQMDFFDDTDDNLSDFALTLTDDEDTNSSGTFSIYKTTEKQEVQLVKDGERFDFSKTYKYAFSYKEKDKVVEFTTGTIQFIDISGGQTVFNEFVFDKTMNFDDGEFTVKLDYIDDFDYYSEFKLIFSNEELEEDIVVPLEATHEEQSFNKDYEYEIYPETTYTYALTCLNNGVSETLDYGEVTFADSLGRVSVFNELLFDGTYDIDSGDFAIQLDYQDDFHYYELFTLHLECEDMPDYPITISLDEGVDVQTRNVSQLDIPIDYEFTYYLTALYKGNEVTLTSGGPFKFNDPNAVSVVNGITFINGEANFENRTFDVQVDYQDDYHYFSDFVLTINDLDNNNSKDYQIDNPEEVQTIFADEMEEPVTADSGYYIDIVSHSLTYNLRWTSWEKGEEETKTLFSEAQPLSFNNSLHSEFYGVESSFDFFTEEAGSYRLPYRLNYIDEAHIYSNFTIDIQYSENGSIGVDEAGQISFEEEIAQNNWTYGYFQSYSSSDETITSILDVESYLVVYAYVLDVRTGETSENSVELYREKVTFTRDQEKGLLGLHLYDYVSAGDYTVEARTIAFNGRDTNYTGCVFIMELSDGTVYSYDFDIGETASIGLTNPNDGTFDEEKFESLAPNGVKITIQYCTLSENPDDPTGAPIQSDPIQLVCYTDYVFTIQH